MYHVPPSTKLRNNQKTVNAGKSTPEHYLVRLKPCCTFNVGHVSSAIGMPWTITKACMKAPARILFAYLIGHKCAGVVNAS